MTISGKTILITGGTSGIGEASTRLFAERGARVVCASNQPERGQALEAELVKSGHEVAFFETDVSDESSVKGLLWRTLDRFDRIDGVFCNAGVWGKGKVTDFNDGIWDKIMGINVKGTFLVLKHAIPPMLEQEKGCIVVTTSVASMIGFPEHALYCASKGALESLVRCLATDYAGRLRAVAISPGTIDTPMLAETAGGWSQSLEELYDDVRGRIPVRRLGEPVDVARTAAFLFSDEADYINGTTLVLDGGTMALPPW
ncbi:MAG TPA: SDR family NAD(P)-dependent oxidoreductase [Acidobacteriota bacterium]|nr:SDR family NAD(P)-dependent oxidoreductase [Acidobacteriota bacterium]